MRFRTSALPAVFEILEVKNSGSGKKVRIENYFVR
jgi:hypothetical protein